MYLQASNDTDCILEATTVDIHTLESEVSPAITLSDKSQVCFIHFFLKVVYYNVSLFFTFDFVGTELLVMQCCKDCKYQVFLFIGFKIW